MTKPKGVRWLEEQTGEALDRAAVGRVSDGKHLSLRISNELASALDAVATERGETVSQTARRLIADGLTRQASPDTEALDGAIAVLEAVRGRMTHRR